MTGKVIALFVTTENSIKKREQVDSIEFGTEGVKKDKFYAKDSQRSVLITSIDSYSLSEKNGILLKQGSLGENILVDINPYHLKAGDQLVIANTTLEITQNCTLCKGLTTIDNRLPKLLKNDRGIFAKVVSNPDKVSIGDTVKILNH